MAEAATQEIRVSRTSRGLAIIITNDYIGAKHGDLRGTHLDGERMKEAFEKLEFDVCWKKNVNQNGIQELWYKIRSFKFDLVKHYECMVFVFSGHGEPEGRDGKLIMQDDTKIDICEDFIAPVLPGNAKEMGDIPKLFFIDACRGDKVTETVDVPTRQGATGKGSPSNTDSTTASRKGCYKIDLRKVPAEGSLLIAYSTLPGCKSNEYTKIGSLWLEVLAKQLQVNPASIEDLLTDVNEELLDYCGKRNLEIQQPEKLVRLNRRLHLLKSKDGHEDFRRRQQTPPEPMELDQPMNTCTPMSVQTQQPPTDQTVSEGTTILVQHIPLGQSGTSVDPEPLPQPQPVPNTPIRPSSNGVVSRPKGSGKYCARLKQHTKPKFDYVADRSSGSTRHRCTISYLGKDGAKKYVDSGYYTMRASAEEQAAKKALSRENWLID